MLTFENQAIQGVAPITEKLTVCWLTRQYIYTCFVGGRILLISMIPVTNRPFLSRRWCIRFRLSTLSPLTTVVSWSWSPVPFWYVPCCFRFVYYSKLDSLTLNCCSGVLGRWGATAHELLPDLPAPARRSKLLCLQRRLPFGLRCLDKMKLRIEGNRRFIADNEAKKQNFRKEK